MKVEMSTIKQINDHVTNNDQFGYIAQARSHGSWGGYVNYYVIKDGNKALYQNGLANKKNLDDFKNYLTSENITNIKLTSAILYPKVLKDNNNMNTNTDTEDMNIDDQICAVQAEVAALIQSPAYHQELNDYLLGIGAIAQPLPANVCADILSTVKDWDIVGDYELEEFNRLVLQQTEYELVGLNNIEGLYESNQYKINNIIADWLA